MNVSKLKQKLDEFIIGQDKQKKKILTAIAQRFKRMNMKSDYKNKILPYNILIKGPSGSGKTYIVSQIAELLDIPFYKTAMTQYSETGYVGKNVEDIITNLYSSMKDKIKKSFTKKLLKDEEFKHMIYKDIASIIKVQLDNDNSNIKKAVETNNEEALDDILKSFIDNDTKTQTNANNVDEIFEKLLNNDQEIMNMFIEAMVAKEITVSTPLGKKPVIDRIYVRKPVKDIIYDIAESKIYTDAEINKIFKQFTKTQIENAIIFLDEIDKIAEKDNQHVSRGGVQNALLTILSGTEIYIEELDDIISTKHMLFIAAGAFQNDIIKISDLKDELLGRFPILIELDSLSEEEYYNILRSARQSVLEQHIMLMKDYGVDINIDDSILKKIAKYTKILNDRNNIGARRLTPFIIALFEELIYNSDNKDTLIEFLEENNIPFEIDNDRIKITISTDIKYFDDIVENTLEEYKSKYSVAKKINI